MWYQTETFQALLWTGVHEKRQHHNVVFYLFLIRLRLTDWAYNCIVASLSTWFHFVHFYCWVVQFALLLRSVLFWFFDVLTFMIGAPTFYMWILGASDRDRDILLRFRYGNLLPVNRMYPESGHMRFTGCGVSMDTCNLLIAGVQNSNPDYLLLFSSWYLAWR